MGCVRLVKGPTRVHTAASNGFCLRNLDYQIPQKGGLGTCDTYYGLRWYLELNESVFENELRLLSVVRFRIT